MNLLNVGGVNAQEAMPLARANALKEIELDQFTAQRAIVLNPDDPSFVTGMSGSRWAKGGSKKRSARRNSLSTGTGSNVTPTIQRFVMYS